MNDWVQFNIYAPTIYGLDKIILEFIDGIIQNEFFKEYFYIRYLDDNGPHIRFRYKCKNSNVQVSRELFEEKFVESNLNISTLSKELGSPMQIGDSTFNGKYYYIPSLYTQELEKYNINNSISKVERYFNVNSNNSIVFLKKTSEKYKLFNACQNILKIISSLLHDYELQSFLYKCSSYWVVSKRQELFIYDKALQFTKHFSTFLEMENSETFSYIDNEIIFLQDIISGFSRSQLFEFLFNIIHMMNNRIGIYPYEEVALFISLSKYLEGDNKR